MPSHTAPAPAELWLALPDDCRSVTFLRGDAVSNCHASPPLASAQWTTLLKLSLSVMSKTIAIPLQVYPRFKHKKKQMKFENHSVQKHASTRSHLESPGRWGGSQIESVVAQQYPTRELWQSSSEDRRKQDVEQMQQAIGNEIDRHYLV